MNFPQFLEIFSKLFSRIFHTIFRVLTGKSRCLRPQGNKIDRKKNDQFFFFVIFLMVQLKNYFDNFIIFIIYNIKSFFSFGKNIQIGGGPWLAAW